MNTLSSIRPPAPRPTSAALSILAGLVLTFGIGHAATGEPLQVVATLPAYASIAQFIGGERVEARAISRGDEDAHFVKPKPSFALMLKRADLFVTTGLDLELWAPVLVDKSGNRGIRDGQPGFVSAARGVSMLDVPQSVSREAGDIHIYGNPHIHTSPLNAKRMAENIATGLARVDPQAADSYAANLEEFDRRLDLALYGDELLAILGSDVLDPLTAQGKLIGFLQANVHEGEPLIARLGGWLGDALSFRGETIVAYHKNWIYLTGLLGLEVADFVERKPGIPPSARHVHDLLETIDQRNVRVILASSYFSHSQIQTIAKRAGCAAAIVDLGPMEVTSEAYFDLVDGWIEALTEAFGT